MGNHFVVGHRCGQRMELLVAVGVGWAVLLNAQHLAQRHEPGQYTHNISRKITYSREIFAISSPEAPAFNCASRNSNRCLICSSLSKGIMVLKSRKKTFGQALINQTLVITTRPSGGHSHPSRTDQSANANTHATVRRSTQV